jgi:hypothetical protein
MISASYTERAQLNAPKSVEEAKSVTQRLLDQGYSDYGVAAAMGLSVEAVRRMIGCMSCE